MQTQHRKPANLSLDTALLSEAKRLKINLSRAAEAGVRAAVVQAQEERWKTENAAALESSNTYAEEHGLPLAKFRQF